MIAALCGKHIPLNAQKYIRFSIRPSATLNIHTPQTGMTGTTVNSDGTVSTPQRFKDIYTDMIIDAVDHKPKMKYEPGDTSFEPTTYPYRKRLEDKIPLIRYALLIPLIFFLMGLVQLHRFFRNYDMMERARSRLMDDHVIHEMPNDITQLQYQRVLLKGKFLFDQEMLAGPCLRFQCQHRRVAANLHIFTPFELENGKIIWVDRGIISYQKYNNPNFDYEHYEPERTIQGFIMDNKLRGFKNPDEYFIADYDDMHIQYFPNEVQGQYPNIANYPPGITSYPSRHHKWLKFWFFMSAIFLYNILKTAPKL